MVLDAHTKIHTKPLADKRERAMEFFTNTTTCIGFSKGQQRFVLDQGVDVNTIVWTVGLC
jgi:hypothetical protein